MTRSACLKDPCPGAPVRCLAPFRRPAGAPPSVPGTDPVARPRAPRMDSAARGSYDPRMATVLPENEEAQRAWDGVLFDRFLHFKHLIVTSLALHGAAAMQAFPPAEGDRVLDIGCGLGDTTVQLAELVGPRGSALGVDISPRFIEAAEADARELGVANARFEVADVQASAVCRHVRLRIRALRDDVLRQPGRGHAQRLQRARARRPPLLARLAQARGQRVDVPRGAGREAARRDPRGDRRGDAAAPARSRWRTPTPRARSTRPPDSSTWRSTGATCR